MKLADFDYALPKDLIAQYPLADRAAARMLVVDRSTGTLEHRVFSEITGYVESGDLVVLNDTRVKRCRLFARRTTGGKVEVLLLKEKRSAVFEALLKPARLKTGERILFDGSGLSATITGRSEVTFEEGDRGRIYSSGCLPLPPYVRRPAEPLDDEYYQTVYARNDGAVAAPTAGLHFTRTLLDELKKKEAAVSAVTLHVGPGTFRPVKSEDITAHRMETEEFFVPPRTARLITETVRAQKRIWAVGTTSVRALESLAAGIPGGETGLFIYPGYTFRFVGGLLTNFHLPRTTLLMLVSAFAGVPLVRRAYQEAVRERYRFYSYGDCMLVL